MHFHDWQQLDHYADVPTNGNSSKRTTSFLVLACICGVATIFPIENYLEAVPEFQQELVEILNRAGLELDTSI
jgi:hypothetical protein